MRNIERLAKHITKYGSASMLVHTIPGTKNWVVAEKFEQNRWLLTMMDPMGYATYNLGMVSDAQHIKLWEEIVRWEIEYKTSQILLARELKKKIYNLKKKYEQNYKRFTKVNQQKSKTRHSRRKPSYKAKSYSNFRNNPRILMCKMYKKHG